MGPIRFCPGIHPTRLTTANKRNWKLRDKTGKQMVGLCKVKNIICHMNWQISHSLNRLGDDQSATPAHFTAFMCVFIFSGAHKELSIWQVVISIISRGCNRTSHDWNNDGQLKKQDKNDQPNASNYQGNVCMPATIFCFSMKSCSKMIQDAFFSMWCIR